MQQEAKRRGVTRLLRIVVCVCLISAGAPLLEATPWVPDYDLLGTESNPTLYQRVGRSEFACLAEVAELGHYATFRAREVYAGRVDEPTFQVIYRGMSWGRRVEGLNAIKFKKGDRFLLFLRYYREHDQPVRPDLFELVDGAWGQIPLVGEGEQVFVEAMRLLIGAATRPTVKERNAVLLGLLDSPNQIAAAAAMTQVLEAGLADIEQIPVLLKQMSHGIADLKLGALQILRKMGPTLPDTFDAGSMAEAIYLRVRWDGGDPLEIRRAAVETLMALGSAALPQVEAVSQTDADQTVRYEAAVWVLENRG